VPEDVVDLIVALRKELTDAGLDAGPDTIAWHLAHHHGVVVSRSTISRHLAQAGLVVPEPRKRPKSSYIRFEATMPNQTWQSDFTHYRLTHPDGTPGAEVEIISCLDDCTRYALHVSAHRRISGPLVTATFRETAGQYGIPASTLTDNGMVYTVRLAGGRGGRNTFENEQRHHRRAPPRARPQPAHRLPRHRSTQRTDQKPPKMTTAGPAVAGPAVSDVLRHHTVPHELLRLMGDRSTSVDP
jgi:hypothetical protein